MERIKTIDMEIYDFITHFKNLLLKNCNSIVGIYLFGSLTYGGFDKGRSDIDIVVITKTLIKGSELHIIKNIHKELENINEKWSKRLEASYTPIEMLKEKVPPKEPRPYCGEIFYNEATYGNEWLINNYLQSYLVLNICRIIYTINKSEVANKQKSCDWVKNKYKEWEELINEAEVWEYNKIMDKENDTKRFIKFAKKNNREMVE
jgi:predicted nucleotidyltransferase